MKQLTAEHIQKAIGEVDREQRSLQTSCGYNGREVATIDDTHYAARGAIAHFAQSLMAQLEEDATDDANVKDQRRLEENATKARPTLTPREFREELAEAAKYGEAAVHNIQLACGLSKSKKRDYALAEARKQLLEAIAILDEIQPA